MRKLSEAEWISRFEQVQGRKPKPDELQLAYQSGLIGISKNYNYIYILLGALVAIVVGIGLTLVSSSMKNVKQSKSSDTVASSIFSSTEKASATSEVLHWPEIQRQVNLAVQVLTHLMLTMPRKPILKIHVGPMTKLVDLLV